MATLDTIAAGPPRARRGGPGAPTRATGLQLLGAMAGSGYRDAPCLVRRDDGQTLQLTPVLYAVLEAIDGERDASAIAAQLRHRHRLDIDPEDIERLVDAKLRPLGLLRHGDGSEPALRRSSPLLALRGRVSVVPAERTQRLAARVAGLFSPVVVAVVLAAFVTSTGWVLLEKGLASGTRQALYEPALLLVVLGLTIVSAAFHELGHAAACHYGGARPGVMGAGLYLVWPAFYTDVTDSYRLDRRGRLRVDLGGLYFNAVFSVVVFGAWAALGWDALLVVIPVQLLQMLRQLVPLVRFDGYHILADLTGVPDLFARIKPVLLAMVPGHRDRAAARVLKPWARGVVTAWVLLVVPVLGLSLALMVAALPRLVATAADSLHLHWDLTVEHWAQGELARTATGIVGLVAITAPLLGIGLLLSRMATRTGRRIWRAADGDPRRQAGVVLAGAALVLALGSAWWPDGQYEPIDADDRGALVDGIGAISAGALGEVPVRAADAGPATEAQGLAADRQADALTEAAEVRAPFVLAPSSSAPQRRSFVPPPPPGEGDNQAVAINRTDGATLVDVSPSLVWAGTDAPVTSRNEAYALASCRDCTTLAVAFQVVVVVGSNDAVAPENEAVAVNAGCEACTTRSLAMQTVVTLPDEPSAGEMDDLERIWSRVEGILAAAGSSTVDETFQRLAAVEAEILGVLEDAQGVPDHDLDSYDAPGPDPADDASNDTTPTTTEATAGSVPADTTGSTSSTSTTSTTTASTTTASTTSTTAPTGTTAPTETEP